MPPPLVLAIYGSPRRKGNTARLLAQAVAGARGAGARVEEVWLRDLTMSPCLEIYACKETGRCAIEDDFQGLYDRLLACRGLMLASPIFFYTVSAHTKIMMDRCQSLWARKYCVEKVPLGARRPYRRRGLFISVGASRGKRLFEGALLSVRYFMDTLDMELWAALTYRGLDAAEAVEAHPEYLDQARRAGAELVAALAGLE
jgi:multimeric flavodoxin WrbA